MQIIVAEHIKDKAHEHLISSGKPHAHLHECKILFVLKEKGAASVSKVNPLWKTITGFDVVVQIPQEEWLFYDTNGKAIAYLDHLLSHIEFDTEKDDYTIQEPSIQEFPAVLHRHGAWRDEIEDLLTAGVEV